MTEGEEIEITVTSGARLHFGLFSHRPKQGREFGGVGLMIEEPGFVVRICMAESNDVQAPEVYHDRIIQILADYQESRGPKNCAPVRIHLEQWYTPHVGLGSGTQLALAIAAGIAELYGELGMDAMELAKVVRRGRRSAIGIHGFEQGGLLVDGGKFKGTDVSPLVSRLEFPDEWPIVIVMPKTGDGLSGKAEVAAFERLPPMPDELSDKLCRMTLMQLLPAVSEACFAEASEAIYEVNRLVGDFFSAEQGGTYANHQMNKVVAQLRERGVSGVGQTSWGPSLFAICETTETAHQVFNDLKLNENCENCELHVTTARNFAAEIS